MNDKQKDLINYIASIPKSLYFNLKIFGFKDGIKFPVIISNNVILEDISGKIEVKNPKPFGIRIGFGPTDIYSSKHEKTIIKNTGKIVFDKKCKIGYGSAISNEGYIELGENFSISFRGKIICRKSIKIGKNSLMAWDTLIMDSDHHPIYENEKRINEDEGIIIGEKNWIGAKSTILKGVVLGDNNVVALGSVLTKKYKVNHKVIGGLPAKIIKDNIEWR